MNNNVADNNANSQGKKGSNPYVAIIIFVVVVLLIAIVLLIFLLTGGIANRNRLTCTKEVNEGSYVQTMKKVYKLEDGKFTRYDAVYTFNYTNGLTDDVYNQTFEGIIDNPNGVSKYGFETNIKREGNIVTLTFYSPTVLDNTYQKIISSNEAEGFTCK